MGKTVLVFLFILKEGTFCCRSQVMLEGTTSTHKEESQEPAGGEKPWGQCQGKGPHQPLSKCFLCGFCCPTYLLPTCCHFPHPILHNDRKAWGFAQVSGERSKLSNNCLPCLKTVVGWHQRSCKPLTPHLRKTGGLSWTKGGSGRLLSLPTAPWQEPAASTGQVSSSGNKKQDKRKRLKLHQGRFMLDVRENFITEKVIKH